MAGKGYIKENGFYLAMFVGLLFVSVFGAWTGSIQITSHIMLMGILAIYLLKLADRLPRKEASSMPNPNGPKIRPKIWEATVGAVAVLAFIFLTFESPNKLVFHFVPFSLLLFLFACSINPHHSRFGPPLLTMRLE